MDFLGSHFQSWRLFSSTSCKKFDFDHFHLKSWIFVFIPPQIFSCEIGTRKFWWISTAFYQWFVKKLKNETVATFYDVCGVFGSENDSFSTFPSRMKVINLFKAKKVTFRERKSSKVEMAHFGSISTQIFSSEMKPVFLLFASRNLAQTNAFWYILLDVNLATQTGISHVHI